MVRRGGSKTIQDRVFASLLYLIPLIEVTPFGWQIFALVPLIYKLFIPIFILLPFYNISIGGIAVVSWGIFFAMYLGIIRNYKMPHFLRYNAMQSLLLSIGTALLGVLLRALGISLNFFGSYSSLGTSNNLILDSLLSLIFITVCLASFYSIFQSLRGLYAEIPVISEVAYTYTR